MTKRAWVSLCLLILAAGCSSPPPPIQDPAPLLNPQQEATFEISVAAFDIGGTMSETIEADRQQTRTVMTAEGKVAYRTVQEARYDGDALVGFRYVSLGPTSDADLTGVVEGDTLRVTDGSGDLVTELPWSAEHRLGGPDSAELVAAGFEEGAKVTCPAYLPWHDEIGVHLVTYTVQGPATFTASGGEQIPAHRLLVQSPQPNVNGSEYLVNDEGQLLEATFLLPAGSFGMTRLTVSLTSRQERE